MNTRRLAVSLFLILPTVLSGARPELSVVHGDTGGSQRLIIQGSSPGMRLQLFDGVHPIGVVVTDASGEGRFAIESLSSGQHAVRAVEWGTGKIVAASIRFTKPGQAASRLAPGVTYATRIRPVVVTTG